MNKVETTMPDERCPCCDRAECGSLLPRNDPRSTLLCDGEPVNWRARCLEAEARTTAYICGACGNFAYAVIDSLDSGTMLTCEKCGGLTVVDLDPPNVRAARYAAASSARAERLAWALAVERLRGALHECAAWLESRPDFTEGDAATSSAARAALSPPGDGTECKHRRRRVHDADCTANPLDLTMCGCTGIATCDVDGCTGRPLAVEGTLDAREWLADAMTAAATGGHVLGLKGLVLPSRKAQLAATDLVLASLPGPSPSMLTEVKALLACRLAVEAREAALLPVRSVTGDWVTQKDLEFHAAAVAALKALEVAR